MHNRYIEFYIQFQGICEFCEVHPWTRLRTGCLGENMLDKGIQFSCLSVCAVSCLHNAHGLGGLGVESQPLPFPPPL